MPKYLVLPKIGMNMEEGVITEWLVGPGDKVEKDQIILRAETDKAVQDIFATESGVIDRFLVNKGDVVPCQANIATLLSDGEEPSNVSEAPKPAAAAAPETAADKLSVPLQAIKRETIEKGRIKISPLARKMAKDLGIDLNLLKPKQEGMRIIKDDVVLYQQAASDKKEETKAAVESSEFVPFSRTRTVIAERMTSSAAKKPRVSLVVTVDCEKLWAWRESLKSKFKVGFNELIIKACAAALKKHPLLNCISEPGGMRLMRQINIGFAVDTDKGLVVPVLRNVGNKGIAELADEMKALIEKAKANTLSLDEMTGGTFTVTNLGMFGIESFDPIINAPECAILGVGAIQETPSVYQHEICIRKCMKISLVFDHAIVDGATAAKMLKDLKEMLEDPLMMLS